MQRLTPIALIGLTIALAACDSEPEGAPDIAQAIPMDEGEMTPGDVTSGDVTSGTDGAGEQAVGGTPALPNADGSNSGSRTLPDTMQAGSNPPDMTEPPKGSKVQRFN